MGVHEPGIGGVQVRDDEVLTVKLGTAHRPEVTYIPDHRYRDGKAMVVRCGCPDSQAGGDTWTRLADGRIKLCQFCGAVIGRCGRKVVAGNWDPD